MVTTPGGSERLRIIDYKTGSDRVDASSVSDMFVERSGHRFKALLQVMLYCNVYAHDKRLGNTPIQPIIYKILKMNDSGFTVNKQVIENYLSINDEFLSMFHDVIAELLNPDIPFRQTANTRHCAYCKFTAFCHR